MKTLATPIHFDFVDLRLFVNVAELSNLTQGARESALSLAAASTRIKHLESALGAPLLYRTQRGVSVTPAGDALLRHARLVLSQVQHLRADLREYSKGVKGHVRVAANTTAVSEFLPGVLAAFLAVRPPVNIDLREMGSPDIVKAVLEGRTDIGIVAGHVGTAGLQTLPFFEDRLLLAVPQHHALTHHALARRGRLVFEAAVAHDFIGLGPDSAMQAFIGGIAAAKGWVLNVRIHVGNYDAMCRMIDAGVGIGLLAESAARRHAQTTRIALIPLDDGWAVQPLKICVRDLARLPGLARDLVAFLVDSAGCSPPN
jgi:DNA-binding transcriptional LysR family regulator